MKNIIYMCLLIHIFITVSNAQEPYWIQRNGPLGGIIHSIVFNSNSDIFIATGDPGSFLGKNGIFRSSDDGHNWEHISIDFTYGWAINCLAISENDHIYAGSYFGGVYKSTDNGETWETINGGLLGGQVIDALTSIGNNIIITAARNGKIYRSADSGATWDTVLDQFASSRTLDVGPDGIVYFGSWGYSYYSTDSGITWQTIDGLGGIGVKDFAFIGNNTILAAVGWGAGIYRSTDNGQTWSPSNNGLPTFTSVNEINIYSENHIFLATRENGIFLSTDYGLNWVSINSGLSRSEILSVNSVVNGPIYSGTDGGFFISTDVGETWSESNNGLFNSILNTIILSPDQNTMYAGTSGGALKSSDFGLTWTRINNGLVLYDDVISLAINKNEILFAGTRESGIYRSLDGENWAEINSELLRKARINSILFDTSGNIFISAVKHINSELFGVLRSNDNGENWEQINNGLTDIEITVTAINSKDVIFIGTYSAGIFYSTNSGDQWHKIQNTAIGNSRITTLKIVENDQIYVGLWNVDGKLYRSTDDGASWNIVEREYNRYINAFEIVWNQYGFIGSNNGIQRYSIESNIWTYIPEDVVHPLLENRWVRTLLKADDGYIYAGTDAAGVFRSRNPIVSSIENRPGYLSEFHIYQNYPNPFNPTTKIKYQIPKISFVTLKVYDVLGSEIATLVSEEKPVGNYEVEFDGSGLTSGVYFYQLKTEGFVETKKMILMK